MKESNNQNDLDNYKTSAITNKLISESNDEALFWNQSYDNNEEELFASCANEWFRVIPNTIQSDLFSPYAKFNKQFIFQCEFSNLNCKTTERNSVKEEPLYPKIKYADVSIDETCNPNECKIQENDGENIILSDNLENKAQLSLVDFYSESENQINQSKNSLSHKTSKDENLNKRKKNRVLTLNESRRKLALRTDVMNKNFFRALRREVKSIFDDYLISNGLSTSRCKRTFKTNLKKYSEYLLNSSEEDNEEIKEGPKFTDFQKVLGVFLNTCLAKKIFTDYNDSDKIEEFNSLLSSYSHQKFYSYIAIPEVRYVIQNVFKETSVEDFVQKNRALSLNRDSYIEHINSILTKN